MKDDIIRNPGKFEGEREAVRTAYDISLDGCCESFDDVQESGFYCAVELEDGETVYFVEDSQGFVREITKAEYDEAKNGYSETFEDE